MMCSYLFFPLLIPSNFHIMQVIVNDNRYLRLTNQNTFFLFKKKATLMIQILGSMHSLAISNINVGTSTNMTSLWG